MNCEHMDTEADEIDGISSDLFGEKHIPLIDKDKLCISRFEVFLFPPKKLSPLPSNTVMQSRTSGDQCEVSDPPSALDKFRRRNKKRRRDSFFITLSHKLSSGVDGVGLQLWRGALLLADFLLHAHSQGQLQGRSVVELGAGVGFLGVILSLMPCRQVFLTDMSAAIAELINKNLATNKHIQSPFLPAGAEAAEIHTRVLDWLDIKSLRAMRGAPPSSSLIKTVPGSGSGSAPWNWTRGDTEALSAAEDVLWLAADVIYDDDITQGLFCAMSRAMRPGEHLLLALEKRFNFEVSSLALVAHGYKKFLSFINAHDCLAGSCDRSGKQLCTARPGGWGEPQAPVSFAVPERGEDGEEQPQVLFRGVLVPLDFPQAVQHEHLERGRDLELWDITCERAADGTHHTTH